MSVLYGMHDRQGAHIVPSGGWCVDTVALSENPAPTDYTALRGDIHWIVRLNWGYGTTGTIPLPIRIDNFVQRCMKYVAKSKGVHAWIIGNEPNHEQERPDGVFITPAMYADCFIKCRIAIKLADPQQRVIPAPCAPYHANPVPWLDYWREMLTAIAANGGCDGIAVHAYARDSDPYDINENDLRMGPPLDGQFAGFLTYVDALDAVPRSLRHLPAYLTEFNELLPDGWDNRNTGVVQAAYESIHGWNQQPDTQKFQCLILYRWPKFDKWHIEGKQGVIDDFRTAVERGYKSPEIAPPKSHPEGSRKLTTHLPNVSAPPPKPEPARDVDPRAEQRGTLIHTLPLRPGEQYWRVKRLYTPDEEESDRLGPDRHILANALIDSQRQVGVPLLVTWGNGGPHERATIHTKRNDNFAFSADHALTPGDFTLEVADGKPSEIVHGIKMGMQTAQGWNPGAHTSTLVDFELATVPESQPAPTTPQPQQPAPMPILAHPIADPARRIISQRFGDNPQDYARFGLAGHTGIDFAVPEGTQVGATDGGQAIEIGTDEDGYGNYVKLRHTWGESLYGHLSRVRVEQGEMVNKGQLIGLSGNTGNSTGPHLHFAIRIFPYTRGAPWDGFSDPAPYLVNTPAQPQPTPDRAELLRILKAAANEYGLQWQLLASLAWGESSWRPEQADGGLFQIGDDAWADWADEVGATDRHSARDNARVAAIYFRSLLRRYGGSERKALWAWNWGPSRVDAGGTPPPLTQEHANKVLHGRDLLLAVGA